MSGYIASDCPVLGLRLEVMVGSSGQADETMSVSSRGDSLHAKQIEIYTRNSSTTSQEMFQCF